VGNSISTTDDRIHIVKAGLYGGGGVVALTTLLDNVYIYIYTHGGGNATRGTIIIYNTHTHTLYTSPI
jgi:hypothetical protein